jgi:hypothetical protein
MKRLIVEKFTNVEYFNEALVAMTVGGGCNRCALLPGRPKPRRPRLVKIQLCCALQVGR